MSAYSFSRAPAHVKQVITPHRRVSGRIPAPGTDKMLARLDAVESRSMHGQLPIVWMGAHDYNIFDFAGNKFLDFTSGIFVANVGHGNKVVREAIEETTHLGPIHSYAYATDTRARYLEKLTAWSGFEKAFLLSAGTEATEAALKLMRLHGMKSGKEKNLVVCVDGNWHGRTMGAQLMSSNMKQREWIGGFDPSILHIKFPYPWDNWDGSFVSLLEGIADRVCGVMLETFQGWGALFYPPAWVQAVSRICRKHNILLCFDEMQSGFARTGKKFGFEHYGVWPDLICVGKGMGNGVPLSGVLGRADVLDLPEVGNMSSTHSGNPLCCAAGLAVIEEIERLSLVNETWRKERVLFPALANLRLKIGRRVSGFWGHGLIAAVHFAGDDAAEFASRVSERCMQKGLLVVHTGRESIKLGPPLTIPDDALLEGVQVLYEAITDTEGETA